MCWHEWRNAGGWAAVCRRCHREGAHWYTGMDAGITLLRRRTPTVDLREVYRYG